MYKDHKIIENMKKSSIGLDLIQLQNIIDAEFEKAKTEGIYNRWTTALPNRAEAVRVKQTELKNLLQSLDVQFKEAEEARLKNTRETDVSAVAQIGSGKDIPIVIDDEEESKEINPTVEPKAGHVAAGKDISVLTNVSDKEEERSTQQEVHVLETIRRRPMILEQPPSIEQSKAETTFPAVSLKTLPEKPNLSPKPSIEGADLTRVEEVVPAVYTESDISTETASSPITDLSQSSLQDEFKTETNLKEEESSQEDSQNEEVSKELDTKFEIPKVKSETAMPSVRPHSPTDFKIGTRVLGKRSSDIWFPGEIVKTMTDKSGQMKYTIKYDKGPKGVLSLNHICPEEPAVMCDLTVGSRVVALYGNLNIWYAGIVAEMACQANRNRLLVFFDDGFAQYLSIKKIHKVHHKGQNVWEDVIEDSRDFIQEYLEDFPSRPMLHVRVGQWIRTEWKGQWLRAKVLSVDGSLVKMLFQIDNRSEWIYRGSTRLDPLYTALVMGEKTKSTKARSRKLTRKTSSKDNAPYIEYNITKPCYGVSAYSKTDPEGIHQSQLEEQRQLTQKQHEGFKHPKEEPKLPSPPEDENQPTPVLERNSPKAPEVKPPPVEESKSLPTAMGSKDVVVLQDEPVIESTFSCIQASTMRKKTGASLVNNVIFKAISPKSNQPESPLLDTQTPSTSTAVLETSKSQTFLDENILHTEPRPENQWKAPWLNIQRNKQRQGATDNVIDTTVPTQKYHDAASILKHKLETKTLNVREPKRVNEIPRSKSEILYTSHPIAHTCSFACSRSSSKVSIDPLKHNPLAIPILMDWKREVVKRRGKTNKRDVYYRTPCNRRLRNMTEVLRYLNLTGESSLNVDHFTFDWRVRTDNPVPPVPVVQDISNGQENRPLPAVNEVDGTRPPNIQYMSMRQFAPEVKLSTEPGFMVCCDCKDNCSDASKCTCIQLTMQGCRAMEMKDVGRMTYQNRRLRDCVQTGIYECNSECSCSKNCLNRVVQNGIQLRLEVFKTENRGWGLRAKDDIPAGTFVCTYAGYILNEELANQDGRKYGDEYMAELDYIEVAEKAKEGYESDVSDLEENDNIIDEMMQSDDNFSYSGNSAIGSRNDDDDEGDEDFSADHAFSFDDDSSSSSTDGVIPHGVKSDKRPDVQSRKRGRSPSEESLVVERESKANVLSRLGTPLICILALKRNDDNLKKTSQFLKQYAPVSKTSDQWNEESCKTMNGVSPKPITQDGSDTKLSVKYESSVPPKGISASTIKEEQKESKTMDKNTICEITPSISSLLVKEIKEDNETAIKMEQEEVPDPKEDISDDKDDIPQLVSADDLQRLAATQPKSLQPPVLTRRGTVLDETIEKLKKRVVNTDLTLEELTVGEPKSETSQTFKDIAIGGKKSSCHSDKDEDNELSGTSSPSRNSSSFSQSASSRSSSPAIELINRFKKNLEGKKSSEKEKDPAQGQTSNTRYLKTRSLFGEEHCYVIDATFGNCGRFLNHSCSPNLFVQNVFIDTHDMRFPWVAFFAQKNIKAGSELTWDYMYEVGSVRDKSLYCLCGSTACRGRLL